MKNQIENFLYMIAESLKGHQRFLTGYVLSLFACTSAYWVMHSYFKFYNFWIFLILIAMTVSEGLFVTAVYVKKHCFYSVSAIISNKDGKVLFGNIIAAHKNQISRIQTESDVGEDAPKLIFLINNDRQIFAKESINNNDEEVIESIASSAISAAFSKDVDNSCIETSKMNLQNSNNLTMKIITDKRDARITNLIFFLGKLNLLALIICCLH